MVSDNGYIIAIIVIMAALIGVAVVGNFIAWYGEFQKELSIINTEISRNTGKEKKLWQRRKCRLILSFFPFIKY